MGRDKMFNPEFRKAFTEVIDREKKLRAKWHLEHGNRLKRDLESCLWDDEPDDDDDDFVKLEISSQPHEVSKEEKSESVKQLDLQQNTYYVAKEKVQQLQIMKPVPTHIKKIFYRGLSHDEEGKARYLRRRYRKDPEDKFYFPICSSWEYGWTYGLDHELKCPDHGRRELIKTSFYRLNDPQLKPRD